MVSRQDTLLDNQTDVSSLFVGLNETDVEAVRALLSWRQQQGADDGWHYAAGVALLVTQLQLDTTSLLAALLLGASVEDAPASEEAKNWRKKSAVWKILLNCWMTLSVKMGVRKPKICARCYWRWWETFGWY